MTSTIKANAKQAKSGEWRGSITVFEDARKLYTLRSRIWRNTWDDAIRDAAIMADDLKAENPTENINCI